MQNLKFYDPTKPPFRLYGVYYEDGLYRRLPYSVAEATSPSVAGLSTKNSGGRVRFTVKGSSHVAIHVEGSGQGIWDVSSITGYHAFDMYNGTRFVAVSRPGTAKTTHEYMFWADPSRENVMTLNFPLSGTVSALYIGVDEGAVITPAPDHYLESPILFYGSSVTQGMCASRPGNIYENLLSRAFDFNYTNMGFAGGAQGEDVIAEYMAGLDMSAFVLDYDHNAPSVEHLAATHERVFLKIREKHPDIPVLMLSRPYGKMTADVKARQDVVKATYKNAAARGDENVWLVLGSEFFPEGLAGDFSVDGTHPNDLGFKFMADAMKRALAEMIERVRSREIE